METFSHLAILRNELKAKRRQVEDDLYLTTKHDKTEYELGYLHGQRNLIGELEILLDT